MRPLAEYTVQVYVEAGFLIKSSVKLSFWWDNVLFEHRFSVRGHSKSTFVVQGRGDP